MASIYKVLFESDDDEIEEKTESPRKCGISRASRIFRCEWDGSPETVDDIHIIPKDITWSDWEDILEETRKQRRNILKEKRERKMRKKRVFRLPKQGEMRYTTKYDDNGNGRVVDASFPILHGSVMMKYKECSCCKNVFGIDANEILFFSRMKFKERVICKECRWIKDNALDKVPRCERKPIIEIN